MRQPDADNLSDDQVNAIHAALRFLAALDGDGARKENGVGFNKHDSYDGHYLASQRYLTAKEAKHGLYIAWRYHRTQLPPDLVARIAGVEESDVELETTELEVLE